MAREFQASGVAPVFWVLLGRILAGTSLLPPLLCPVLEVGILILGIGSRIPALHVPGWSHVLVFGYWLLVTHTQNRGHLLLGCVGSCFDASANKRGTLCSPLELFLLISLHLCTC